MLTIQMIKEEIHISWQVRNIIQLIKGLTKDGNFLFQHCFQERNMVIERLANLGENIGRNKFFNQTISLPSQVKALSKNDQDGSHILALDMSNDNTLFLSFVHELGCYG